MSTIFRTGLRAPHVVLAGAMVAAGTVVVTPGLEIPETWGTSDTGSPETWGNSVTGSQETPETCCNSVTGSLE